MQETVFVAAPHNFKYFKNIENIYRTVNVEHVRKHQIQDLVRNNNSSPEEESGIETQL